MKVLDERRSPLAFRFQPLVLHLNTFDDLNDGWKGAQEPGMLLVARREVLAAVDAGPSASVGESTAAETDGKTGEPVDSPVTTAGADSKGRDGSSHSTTAVMRVAEVEELGRIGPFTINSATTVLSGASLTVPSNALVADVQRRSGAATGRNVAGIGEESVENIVLEIIRNTTGGEGNKGPFLKKRKKRTRDSTSEEDPDGGSTVVARATLDPGFLRRTIGCQRSVLMMAPPARVGGASISDQNAENAGQRAPQDYARLFVAGHVVSARPGRPRLRVQVLECQNLRSADVLGKSDPCVLVFWDGVEVGRTPIARQQLHPAFPASGATFRLPLVPPSATKAEEYGRRPNLKRFVDWQAYAPELRLEVWDMDRDVLSRKWKKGQLLGSVNLQGPGGIAPVVEASTDQGMKDSTSVPVKRLVPGVVLRLNATDRRASTLGSAERKPDQASIGVVSVRVAVENGNDDSEAWLLQENMKMTIARGSNAPGMVSPALDSSLPFGMSTCSPETSVYARARLEDSLGIWCLDARGLPVGCDGYCRVFWNGMQVGSTPRASRVSQGLRDNATVSKHHTAPASAFRRNPVWWMSLTHAKPCDGRGDEMSGPNSSSATAVVPLNESPQVADELTLEVFDGSHVHETNQSIALWGDPVAGKGAADGRNNSGVFGMGPDNSHAIRRDVLGRSLGNVTIRGEYLVRPPSGRIDLPLQLSTPSSSKDSNAAGITLSITLTRLLSSELSADSMTFSTHPRRNSTPEQEQHTRNNIATTSVPVGDDGGQADVSEKETTKQRPTRWLRLFIEGAHLFKGLDISGTSDPFCTVYVDRVWHSETRVCWGTLAPRWHQWVEIEVFGRAAAPALGLGLAGHEIRVEVWDKDLVGANDFIGEAHLLLHVAQDG